ncbi:MAG: hypothetical protein AB7F43_01720 [Bacteriovoracia bacterium]
MNKVVAKVLLVSFLIQSLAWSDNRPVYQVDRILEKIDDISKEISNLQPKVEGGSRIYYVGNTAGLLASIGSLSVAYRHYVDAKAQAVKASAEAKELESALNGVDQSAIDKELSVKEADFEKVKEDLTKKEQAAARLPVKLSDKEIKLIRKPIENESVVDPGAFEFSTIAKELKNRVEGLSPNSSKALARLMREHSDFIDTQLFFYRKAKVLLAVDKVVNTGEQPELAFRVYDESGKLLGRHTLTYLPDQKQLRFSAGFSTKAEFHGEVPLTAFAVDYFKTHYPEQTVETLFCDLTETKYNQMLKGLEIGALTDEQTVLLRLQQNPSYKGIEEMGFGKPSIFVPQSKETFFGAEMAQEKTGSIVFSVENQPEAGVVPSFREKVVPIEAKKEVISSFITRLETAVTEFEKARSDFYSEPTRSRYSKIITKVKDLLIERERARIAFETGGIIDMGTVIPKSALERFNSPEITGLSNEAEFLDPHNRAYIEKKLLERKDEIVARVNKIVSEKEAELLSTKEKAVAALAEEKEAVAQLESRINSLRLEREKILRKANNLNAAKSKASLEQNLLERASTFAKLGTMFLAGVAAIGYSNLKAGPELKLNQEQLDSLKLELSQMKERLRDLE